MSATCRILPRHVTGLLLLLVVVPRLLLLNAYTDSPYFDVFGWDPRAYDELAQAVAAGAWLPAEAFHQPPLYPYALGLLYAAIGRDFYLIYLIQIIMSTLSGWWLYRLARDHADEGVARLALLLYAAHGLLAFYTLKLLSETLTIFLCLLLVRVLEAALARPAWPRWAGAGVLLGLTVLVKPNMLLLAPLALIPLLWAGGRGTARAACALAFVATAVLVILPVPLANRQAEGDWILVSWNGGGNLYSGNSPGATGFPAPLPGVTMDRQWRPVDEREVVSSALGRPVSAGEISDYWSAQARAFVVREPAAWLRLLGRKAALALSPVEHSHMYYLTYERRHFTPLLWAFPSHFGLLLPPAVVGMLIAAREWRRHWLLYAMVAVTVATLMIFYVLVRLRLPVEPFLILFAAMGLRRLTAPAAGRARLLAVLTMVAALVVGLWWRDRGWYAAVESINTSNLGELYFEAGRYAEAEQAYRRALAQNPANVHVALGFCKLLVAADRHADALSLHAAVLPVLDTDMRRAFLREPWLAAIRPALAQATDAPAP